MITISSLRTVLFCSTSVPKDQALLCQAWTYIACLMHPLFLQWSVTATPGITEGYQGDEEPNPIVSSMDLYRFPNFEEAKCWQSSTRAEVAYVETFMFDSPLNVKAVTISMRRPLSWGYFGINSVALLAGPGPYMLFVHFASGITSAFGEQCLTNAGAPGVTPEPYVEDGQQAAWKHDVARNPDVSDDETTWVELCDVNNFQHPSGFAQGGPHKDELVEEFAKKLVGKSVQPSDLTMMVGVRWKSQLFVIFGNRQLKALHLAQRAIGRKRKMQVECFVHDLSQKDPPELIFQFILASSCDHEVADEIEHQSDTLHEDQAQNDEVGIVGASVRLLEELELKMVWQLMTIVGTGPKIKEELSDDGNENHGIDEPRPKTAILDAEQMKILRRLQQGASKHDQDYEALAMWKNRVQPCDVKDLRQTHDTVAPHFLHGPRKGESINYSDVVCFREIHWGNAH